MAALVTDRMHLQAFAAAEAQRANPDGQKVAEHPSGDVVEQVSVAPDGVLFATTGEKGHVAVWHTATCLLARTLQGWDTGIGVFCHAWSSDSSRIATGDAKGNIVVWDVATGAVKVSLEGHDRAVHSVAWSPDGLKLCSASFAEILRVWDVATGDEVVHAPQGPTLRPVCSVAWSPDGASVAAGSPGGAVHFCDATTGSVFRVLEGETAPCMYTSICWSPAGRLLAALYDDRAVRVWDATTATMKHTLGGHSGCITSIAWSPDERHIATGTAPNEDDAIANGYGHFDDDDDEDNENGVVKVWDAATGTRHPVIGEVHDEIVTSVAWSRCGNLLFISSESSVYLYKVSGGR